MIRKRVIRTRFASSPTNTTCSSHVNIIGATIFRCFSLNFFAFWSCLSVSFPLSCCTISNTTIHFNSKVVACLFLFCIFNGLCVFVCFFLIFSSAFSFLVNAPSNCSQFTNKSLIRHLIFVSFIVLMLFRVYFYTGVDKMQVEWFCLWFFFHCAPHILCTEALCGLRCNCHSVAHSSHFQHCTRSFWWGNKINI